MNIHINQVNYLLKVTWTYQEFHIVYYREPHVLENLKLIPRDAHRYEPRSEPRYEPRQTGLSSKDVQSSIKSLKRKRDDEDKLIDLTKD